MVQYERNKDEAVADLLTFCLQVTNIFYIMGTPCFAVSTRRQQTSIQLHCLFCITGCVFLTNQP